MNWKDVNKKLFKSILTIDEYNTREAIPANGYRLAAILTAWCISALKLLSFVEWGMDHKQRNCRLLLFMKYLNKIIYTITIHTLYVYLLYASALI